MAEHVNSLYHPFRCGALGGFFVLWSHWGQSNDENFPFPEAEQIQDNSPRAASWAWGIIPDLSVPLVPSPVLGI